MILEKNILKTSVFISFFKVACESYFLFEERLVKIYRNSILYAKLRFFLKRVGFVFLYNFLCRVLGNKAEEYTKKSSGTSKVIKYLLMIHDYFSEQVINTSLVAKFTKKIKNDLFNFIVRDLSIIIVIALLSNQFLYSLFKNYLQNKIGLLNWITGSVLLILGLAGLFCEVSLKVIINTSSLIQWIKQHNRQCNLEEK